MAAAAAQLFSHAGKCSVKKEQMRERQGCMCVCVVGVGAQKKKRKEEQTKQAGGLKQQHPQEVYQVYQVRFCLSGPLSNVLLTESFTCSNIWSQHSLHTSAYSHPYWSYFHCPCYFYLPTTWIMLLYIVSHLSDSSLPSPPAVTHSHLFFHSSRSLFFLPFRYPFSFSPDSWWSR